MHQHGRHRASPGVEMRLDHVAGRGCLGVGLELLELGCEADHLEQGVEPLLRLGGHVDEDRVPSPFLGVEPLRGQFVADPVGLGIGAIDLVHGNEDRNARSLRVVDRLNGLRHHAVVGGDDDHRQVGHLRAARPHRRERLVARGVEEGDPIAVLMHLIGADVLGDPARLAGDHLGLADRVEQRRLAVVHVAHDRHDRRPGGEVLVGVVVDRLLDLLLGAADDLDLLAERFRQGRDGLVGQRLGERRHLAQLHELLDHLGAAEAEALGHLTHGRAGRDLGRLRLRRLTERLDGRLFEQRPPAPPSPAPRGTVRRRLRHVLAARRLRVDHDPPALAPSRSAARRSTGPGPPRGRARLRWLLRGVAVRAVSLRSLGGGLGLRPSAVGSCRLQGTQGIRLLDAGLRRPSPRCPPHSGRRAPPCCSAPAASRSRGRAS